MMDFFSQHWALAIDWVSVHAVTPVVNALHIAEAAGDPREIAAGILIALLQLFLIGCVMRPLESLIPAERWADRRHTTVDRNYTLLMLLGLFPLFSFLILMPVAHMLGGGPSRPAASRPGCPGLKTTPMYCLPCTTWSTTSRITGCTAPSTSFPGGGPCTACTTASAR
jgi:hypothetical protein